MEFEIYNIALIPVIIGIVSVLKSVGFPSKYASLVSIGLGIPLGVFYLAPSNLSEGILVGITLGLASSGLYSGTKNIVRK
ncbi:hypothetical protein [Longirhabdus pacifica]|uniref:hypothetical protein n=1 Tax=Longirhabdus pacifica TaxID=2305227 RepID=UPI0010092619|nr:hypothetical protein [Longirhabdus pacifica]